MTQSPPIGSPPVGFDWQYSLWTKHNTLRSEIAMGNISSQPFSTNMEHILYDSNLEQTPLNHALQCNYTHNMDINQQVQPIKDTLSFKILEGVLAKSQFGENIAYHSIGPFLDADNLQNIIQQQWFDIHQYYDYYNNKCDPTQDCSSYQKLLWAQTRYMACGVSICPVLYLPNNQMISKPVAFIVCDYWPTYDEDDIPIYKTVSLNNDDKIADNICTECSSDRSTQCENGLCSGCPAPKYNFCQDRLPICSDSKDKCKNNTGIFDVIIQEYCGYTCSCSANDWIPDTQCNNLYLSPPTEAPTPPPISDHCKRLGWFDVSQLENDQTIECPNGYMLPNNHESTQYIENNCLEANDVSQLNYVIGPGYKSHGIAMDWIMYDRGCEWDDTYRDGVILTHTGFKCGDAIQLFICVADYTQSPTTTTTIELTIPDLDTEAPTETIIITSEPTIVPTDSPITSNPTKMPTDNPTNRPSWSPSDKPTDEPSVLEDTTAPTSSPTEGPTFSPTMEPTNEPTDEPSILPTTIEPTTTNPTTAMPTVETSVEMEYDPFRMYLLFPQNVNGNVNGNVKNVRRLREDINYRKVSSVHSRKMMDDDSYIELYPLNAISKLWPMKNNNGYGYEFNLSKKTADDIEVRLTEVIYTINGNLCGLDVDTVDETLIKFHFFRKYKGEWIDIEPIGYIVKLKENIDKTWVDIIINIDDRYSIKFDVSYMFVIDVSLLMNNCMDLLHPIYVKSFGKFNVEKNNFMVNGLKSVTLLNDNVKSHCKYWMRMSMVFN